MNLSQRLDGRPVTTMNMFLGGPPFGAGPTKEPRESRGLFVVHIPGEPLEMVPTAAQATTLVNAARAAHSADDDGSAVPDIWWAAVRETCARVDGQLVMRPPEW